MRHNQDNPSTSLTLMERAKNNETEAWQSLVELYAPLIYSRCRGFWGLNQTDSENTGQEVFQAIARNLGDFSRQRTGSFRRWIRVITDNKCRDLLRKRRDTAQAVGGSEANFAIENLPDSASSNESGEIASDASDKALVMRQAMSAIKNEVSDRDFKIFWSIVIDEKYRQDIARELGVTNNLVYVVYSRIKKRLREVYEDLIDDDLLKFEIDNSSLDAS